MHKRLIILVLVLTAVLTYAYAQNRTMRTVGYASYYHDRFHGRRMANGQRYHRDSLTCAHLRFPLGTMLRVTNIRTGKSVEVKVTDRGPYSRRFIVDLSRRAARELGVIGSAHVEVELTPLGDVHIPFRIAKTRAEENASYIYDILPFGDLLDNVWDSDSIFRQAQNELQERIPRPSPSHKERDPD